MTGEASKRVVHLAHETVSVVVDVSGGVPDIVHWGAPLSSPDAARFAALTTRPTTHGSLDSGPPLQVVPQHSLGTLARPGLLGHRPGGRDWSARFGTCEVDATSRS
ncbi:MAG: alpha-galactosidase, partial [Actinomycetota bacterium]